jgi:hypothetical protein
MKRYQGGESAPQGVYLSLSTGEFIQLYGEVLILPGKDEVKYVKVPAPLMMVAGPFVGLAFIIFLPVTGVLGISSLLAYKVGRRAQALGHRVLQPAAISWRPGVAYLTRRGHKPEEVQPTESDEEGLTELEQEVASRRKQEEE